MDVMLRNWDDTKLISYLATNSCAGNRLGLKDQAQEFAGNYAVEDIKDITKIPLPELLEYNLVDCLSTWYVYEKNHPIMVQDDQLDFYNDMFKPAILDIIQMQLTGMPLDMDRVAACRMTLNDEREDAIAKIQSNMLVREFTETLNQEWVVKKNETLKVKVVSIADAKVVFNPGSSVQKQRLLFDVLGLPVIQLTDKKQPATGHEVLEKLKAYTEDQDEIDLIDVFLDFAAVDKIYTTFIPAMEQAILAADGTHYLFGNFNLGGTVSGRLSSSEPNLQNLPSSGATKKKKYYAKLIKQCFRAPKGWLFVGLDFSSLEDRISALTTKDSQKLKVYTDGYDGHCLRAFSYFKEKMPGIEDTVSSINSIADLFPDQRQDSKVPTFLLTYQGTYIGMMAKCGFTKIVAMQIEQRYHELYKESDAWVAAKLDEASKVGYITGAFGLRVRTPLLHQVIRGNSSTPYEAEAEGRTAGNALGQSWGLLNTRANAAFMRTVRAGPYRLDIRPISQIHDAGYYLVRDDVDALEYLNTHLVKEVEWQDHPAIEHDVVKLGGELALYHPSWADEIKIKNGASQQDMRNAVAEKVAKLAA
jgi:DNA polymerase-1